MANTVVFEYDITIYEGATYDKVFRWLIDDVLISLSGVTGIMQVRDDITNTSVILDLPFVVASWVADGTSGIYLMDIGVDDKYRIYINDEDSSGICADNLDIVGTYNLFLYNNLDECILKQYGAATLIAAVAR